MTLSAQLTEAITEAKDIAITDIDIEPGQEPSDDLDDDFIVPIEAQVVVSGAALARLVGKQRRTLGKWLGKLTSKQAISRLTGSPVANELLRLAKPKIRNLVVSMADDLFERGARVTGIELADPNQYWEAHIDPRKETIRFNVFFDVLGRWA